MATTTGVKIERGKVPELLTTGTNSVLYVENKNGATLQWSATPANDAWHSMNESRGYEFNFDVYVRNIGSNDATIVVTTY